MGFKTYEQNQLMIPMQWNTLIKKEDLVFVLNDVIDKMNIDKLIETYSPLGSDSYHPKMMLKILMYGYIRRRYSARLIAELVENDIKFIWLAGGNKPTRNVINSFRKDKMKLIMEEVFSELLIILESKGYINSEEYFVDGTKIEANANKYSFVWKKSVERQKELLQKKVRELMEEIDRLEEEEEKSYSGEDKQPEEVTPDELEEFAKRLSDKLNCNPEKEKTKEEKQNDKKIKRIIKKINTDFKPRLDRYNKDLKIMGADRNSYSKTDKDATFMHMKEDHMRNGQLKPGYNVQVGTCNDFITTWSIHQNRSDNGTLIPHLERHKRLTGKDPDKLGADSGYGNQENYEYLKRKKIKNFVKYTYFHKDQKKSFQNQIYNWQNMPYDEINDEFTCPEGNKLKYIESKTDITVTGFKQEYRIYEYEDCSSCAKKHECTKAKGNRQINFYKKMWILKQEAKKNLLSEEGIQMRKKRAEFSERVFGQIKWNMGFKRFTLRGLEKVDVEWGLLCLAFNIKKMYKRDILKAEEKAKRVAISIINFITTKIPAVSHWNFCARECLF